MEFWKPELGNYMILILLSSDISRDMLPINTFAVSRAPIGCTTLFCLAREFK
jgi:hypothetical protein